MIAPCLLLLGVGALFYKLSMALTSSSTFTDAYAQLNDNLDWFGSAPKARLYLEAALWFVGNRPTFSMRQNAQINYESLQKLIEAARKFLEGTDTARQATRTYFVRGKPRAC